MQFTWTALPSTLPYVMSSTYSAQHIVCRQPKGVKPKMRRQKLRYKVNWQGALEQEVIKQTGIKQVLLVLPTTDRKEMCNIRDRWQKNICTLISTITAECTTLFVGEYQPNIIAMISMGIKRKHLDGITTRNKLLHSISTN